MHVALHAVVSVHCCSQQKARAAGVSKFELTVTDVQRKCGVAAPAEKVWQDQAKGAV